MFLFPEWIMKSYKEVIHVTFESVDKILWCDYSNETSTTILLKGTICFSAIYEMNSGNFVEFWLYSLLDSPYQHPWHYRTFSFFSKFKAKNKDYTKKIKTKMHNYWAFPSKLYQLRLNFIIANMAKNHYKHLPTML